MEPYVQLQEYSTKFFIQLNHKKKKSLCYGDMRSWIELCKSKKNRVEWKLHPTRSTWSVKDNVRHSIIKTHAIYALLALFSFKSDTRNKALCL